MTDSLSIGVISDTHGVLLPGVAKAFNGVSQIIHAGDIDKPQVLTQLEIIAPVTAVLGNMDSEYWFGALPEQTMTALGRVTAIVVHDVNRLNGGPPETSRPLLVISGHTHKRQWSHVGNTYYLNPGSARSPRGGGRPSVAILKIDGKSITCRFINL